MLIIQFVSYSTGGHYLAIHNGMEALKKEILHLCMDLNCKPPTAEQFEEMESEMLSGENGYFELSDTTWTSVQQATDYSHSQLKKWQEQS